MRAFQLISIIIFVLVYLLISFGSIKGILQIVFPAYKKLVFRGLLVFSSVMIACFIFLYVWPFSTRNTQDYTIHLIFNVLLSMDFVFKLPLVISYFLSFVFSGKSKSIISYMGLVLSTGLVLSVLYGTIYGKSELKIKTVELDFKLLPKEFHNLRILHISDTHLGGFMKSKKVMNLVGAETNKANPDIILFTGDLVNNFYFELEGWTGIFQNLTKEKPSYAILGNHDYGNYSNWKSESEKVENFNQIVNAHKDFGFQLLNNKHVILKSGEDSIYIIGVENWGHPPFPQHADLEQAMNGVPKYAFKILLTHDPAHWDEVIKHRGDVQLTLSGHTHGMQWGIVKAGITFSLSYFVRHNWGGLYKYENSYLYVNTGLGTVGIPWRINMPAEMTVITLKRVEVD